MAWGARAVAVAACALALTACGDETFSDLPKPPKEKGGPAPVGVITFQLPFVPISFSIDSTGTFRVNVESSIVTGLGTVRWGAGGEWATLKDDRPLRREAADVKQLIICQKGSRNQRCEAYRIGSGRKMRITMAGKFDQVIEDRQISISASPGSIITVTDLGPQSGSEVHGPARIAIENHRFLANSEDDAHFDLERSRSGTTADLSYDHLTGQLRLENGAQVARLKKYKKLHKWKADIPSEQDCLQIPYDQWKGAFEDQDLTRTTR
jgi:hypothetical protein